MKIIINNTSMVPIYEQIMEQIKAQIISGELKENDILPSVRTMAKELKISALTVKKAYDNLCTIYSCVDTDANKIHVRGWEIQLLI